MQAKCSKVISVDVCDGKDRWVRVHWPSNTLLGVSSVRLGNRLALAPESSIRSTTPPPESMTSHVIPRWGLEQTKRTHSQPSGTTRSGVNCKSSSGEKKGQSDRNVDTTHESSQIDFGSGFDRGTRKTRTWRKRPTQFRSSRHIKK